MDQLDLRRPAATFSYSEALRKFRGQRGSRGHSEMGSRDHGMVEFGVQIPMAPFDSLRSSIQRWWPVVQCRTSGESNALSQTLSFVEGSERSESNGLHHVRICTSRFLFCLRSAM